VQPLIATLAVCIVAVVLYPPAALAVFAVAILGLATWRKAQQRDGRNDRNDPR
jgi:hypothetical protein